MNFMFVFGCGGDGHVCVHRSCAKLEHLFLNVKIKLTSLTVLAVLFSSVCFSSFFSCLLLLLFSAGFV